MLLILGRSMVRTSDSKSENQGSIPCRGVFLLPLISISFYDISPHLPNQDSMTDKISIMKITTLTQFIELASFGSIDYLTPLRSKSLGRLE